MKTRLTIMVHCLIRNEERWIWYAINSIIDWVDKILVYDTGSSDRTVDIVKSMKSPKVIFEEKGKVDAHGMTRLRQEMLDRTDSAWFMILDGDEIWPTSTLKELTIKIRHASKGKQAVVVSPWTCLGDIYHYSGALEKLKSPYGLSGFRQVRIIKKDIPGLHALGMYPQEGFSGSDGKKFSDYTKDKLIFLQGRYFHMSFLPRSSNRKKDAEVIGRRFKTKFSMGELFPQSMKYPEIFYIKRPSHVPSPWRRSTLIDQVKRWYYRGENVFHMYER